MCSCCVTTVSLVKVAATAKSGPVHALMAAILYLFSWSDERRLAKRSSVPASSLTEAEWTGQMRQTEETCDRVRGETQIDKWSNGRMRNGQMLQESGN